MQPYFLPYIGYWQLMRNVDIFVVYDDIEYTKRGWINRNRFLLNGKPELFTLPLRRDSDFLDIRQRQLSDRFDVEKEKLMRRILASYRNAPFFDEGKLLLQDILTSNEKNLFRFIFQSIEYTHTRLRMTSSLVVSSTLGLSRQLKGQDRVVAICKALDATDYINPIGGVDLYDRNTFRAAGIQLHFQQVEPFVYEQSGNGFVPNLSLVDAIMFVGFHKTIGHLSQATILRVKRDD